MANNNSGIVGKKIEPQGKTFVAIPESQWHEVAECVYLNEDLVPGDVVCKELHITKKTLSNLIWLGKITRKMYVITVTGMKLFYNKLILGIKK